MSEGIQLIRDLVIILLSATAAGWGARKLKLSPIVGYLGAGLIIGTPQVTFVYVTDPERIQVLSQIGLVFLMFAIGLGVRLRQLRELGVGPVVATLITSLLMLTLGRLVALGMGLDRVQALFFASMLVVSSSAIIGKILSERRLLHERAGQLALSHTLLEDFVAIVLLAVLGSVVAFEQPAEGGGFELLWSLAKLGGFVLLVLLAGLVLLPVVMRHARAHGGEELLIVCVGGLVFGLALVSVLAGYSLALGAFLFGVLIAETRDARSVARAFAGMRDVFTAVFFVAIGMTINVGAAGSALWLVVAGTLLALVGRALLGTVAWVVACERVPTALRTACAVTPIGEFSFIIAGLGVTSGVLPERFQVAAVGIAFLTSILAPLGMTAGENLAVRVSGDGTRAAPGWLLNYRRLWQRLGQSGGSHLLWKFMKKRVVQMSRELAWVAALLVFAGPVYVEAQAAAEASDGVWLQRLLPWFWLIVFLLLLIPVVSLLRNIQAVSLILVDYYAMQNPGVEKRRQTWTFLVQMLGTLLLLLLIGNLLPWWLLRFDVLLGLLAVTLILMVVLWKRLIRLHSHAEVRIQEVMGETTSVPDEWLEQGESWGLLLDESVLPDNCAYAGRTLGDLGLRTRTGATVIGVERQGILLEHPGPATQLFPDDKLFLIGDEQQVREAQRVLGEENPPEPAGTARALGRAVLQSVKVEANTRFVGRRLSELAWPARYGVQVVSARSEKQQRFIPNADWIVAPNVELLLAGTPVGLERWRQETL